VFLKGFWGQFNGTIDEKGRLMLPQKLREMIPGERLILTKGSEKCLCLYEYEKFEEIMQKMLASETLNQVDRDDILRRIVAPASDIQIDATGRLKLPPALMKQMGLVKNCYVLGMGSRIELWDESVFESLEESRQNGVKTSIDELRKREGVIL
jgi:MraZ protein